MSIELIENEIRRFIATTEPEVVCISGHWGVGKTFAWNQYLKEEKAKNTIGLPRYSYVSLFGVNSLEEFRHSIYENSVPSSDIGIEPSLETLQSNTIAVTKSSGKKLFGLLQQNPFLNRFVGGVSSVLFLSVRETIVCVDDLERRGKNLSIRDVFGLICNLKEHKGCKVILILNDEVLEDDEKEFEKYLEKVIDTSLKFAPSAKDCIRIALAKDIVTSKLLAENCIKLGIANIRIIRKIERAVGKIEPMLKEFDEQIVKQAVQSLALFGLVVYEPGKAPSLEYLKKRRKFAGIFDSRKKEPISENEAAWNAMLDAYGFSNMDEFDLALLSGIQNGYFDSALVKKHASELDKQIKAAKLNSSFESAWRTYHDSFDDNQKEALDAIYESFFKNVQYISPMNLDGTVRLLKDLGRSEQAADVIKHYMASRNEDKKFFDLDNPVFSIDDPDVIQAFKDKLATFKDERKSSDILLSINQGWTDEDINILAALSVDEYCKIFRENKGETLRKIIDGCLQFDRISNASGAMREISNRARGALKLIGQESAINARRVKKYGVQVEDISPLQSSESE